MNSRKSLSVCVIILLLSVILIIGGFVLVFIWPLIVQNIIDNNFVLKKNSGLYSLWKSFPNRLPINFYFFNWTNPQDVYNISVKPRFVQMGPYSFMESKTKQDIEWNDNGTVTFKHLKHWFSKDEFTHKNAKDIVTTVNPVALAAAYQTRYWKYIMRKGLSVSLSKVAPNIHISKTVSQMLFEGFKDPLITLARSFSPMIGAALPPWDRFGWFYTRNGSSDFEGVFNMGTGLKHTELGKLYNWNYANTTRFYNGTCSLINGSAGEFFPQHPPKDTISLFSPDLCRTMTLSYAEEAVVDGILGNKYVVGDFMLDNGTKYEKNRCFCNGECVPSGLLNVSSCRYGSPAFASLPHFYQADSCYTDIIEGLSPSKRKHEFYIILESVTGVPLEVSARLQINLLMQPVSGISLYENAPKMFVPMVWFEQNVKIPETVRFKLKLLLNLPIICSAIGILLIFVGLIIFSCLIYKVCTSKTCRQTRSIKQKRSSMRGVTARAVYRKP